MSPATPTVSATPATPPAAPDPFVPLMSQNELDALNAESKDINTLLGVSAMKARLLYQAVGYLAQIAAGKGLADTVKLQLDELHTHLKAADEKIDKLTCQVRELREEVLGLIEKECREPCGKLAAEIELLAARLEMCEAALPRAKK